MLQESRQWIINIQDTYPDEMIIKKFYLKQLERLSLWTKKNILKNAEFVQQPLLSDALKTTYIKCTH